MTQVPPHHSILNIFTFYYIITSFNSSTSLVVTNETFFYIALTVCGILNHLEVIQIKKMTYVGCIILCPFNEGPDQYLKGILSFKTGPERPK